ncbi:hypothetical protein JCM5296_004959 [Sporobolomyces johnsonii]
MPTTNAVGPPLELDHPLPEGTDKIDFRTTGPDDFAASVPDGFDCAPLYDGAPSVEDFISVTLTGDIRHGSFAHLDTSARCTIGHRGVDTWNRQNSLVMSNYDLAARIAPFLSLRPDFDDHCQLRLLAQPLPVLDSVCKVPQAVQALLRRPDVVMMPRLLAMQMLTDIRRGPNVDVDLVDPSRCYAPPSAGHGLLVEFVPLDVPSRSSSPSLPDLPSPELPVPPFRLSTDHTLAFPAPSPDLPQPPALFPASQHTIPIDGPNYDLYRPQGQWSHPLRLPAQYDEPVWAWQKGGGGKTKRVPGRAGPGLPTRSRNVRWNTVALPNGEGQGYSHVVYHEGFHRHQEPPVRSVPSTVVDRVAEILRSNPTLTGAQLQTGAHTYNPQHPFHRPALADIHPKLTTSAAVAQVRDAAHEQLGFPRPKAIATKNHHIISLDRLAALSKACPDAFRSIDLEAGIISISLQSSSMRELLNSTDEELGVVRSLARSGLATDAHNTYFDGVFTLVQTVVFCDRASCWFPVLYTITDKESAEAYDRHFTTLLHSFDPLHNSLDNVAIRFLHVMDFSSTQNRGFVNTFVRYYAGRQATVEVGTSEVEGGFFDHVTGGHDWAERLVRGCEHHLDANVHRAARSLRIGDGEVEDFVQSTRSLFRSSTAVSAATRQAALVKRWPVMESWLDWWTTPRIARMIVKFGMKMSPDDVAAMPTTTNAVESAHMVLLKGAGGEKFSLETGLEHLVDVMRAFEAREAATHAGYVPKPLRPSVTDPSECRPPRRRPVPYAFTNSGIPPPSVYLKKRRRSHPAVFPPPQASLSPPPITCQISPAPSIPPEPLIPSAVIGIDPVLLPQSPRHAAQPGNTPTSTDSGVARNANGRIIEPEWQGNSCWLDAILAIRPHWLMEGGTSPTAFDIGIFSRSSAVQTDEMIAVWRTLGDYLDWTCSGGFDSRRITHCTHVSDGELLCHAPGTHLRRLSSLPYFLGVSLLPTDPSCIPPNFFNPDLSFRVKGTDYLWTLVGRSEYSNVHYRVGVRTGTEEWTVFDSLNDKGLGASSVRSTPPPLGDIGGVSAFYRFSQAPS